MAPSVRPFRFDSLERWTRAQLSVLESLQSYLPASPFSSEFKQRMQAVLRPYVNCDVDVWLDSMMPIRGDKILASLTSPTLVAVLGLPPDPHKVLLEIDLALASMAVERVLGGKGEDHSGQTPLSEIEQGVFAFLLLKVLSLLRGELGDEARTGIKLEAFRSSPRSLIDDVTKGGGYFVLGFKFFFELSVGFARLYVPDGLVGSKLRARGGGEGPVARRSRDAMRASWQRLDGVRCPLVIEAGRSELNPQDIADLEVGDIILVEETQLQLSGDQLSGPARAHIGLGQRSGIVGHLQTDASGRLQFVIEDLVEVGEPEAANDRQLQDDGRGEAPDDGDDDDDDLDDDDFDDDDDE